MNYTHTHLQDVLGSQHATSAGGKAVSLGSVFLGVAQLAVNVAVGGVAQHHGVEGPEALAAAVAPLVPPLTGRGGDFMNNNRQGEVVVVVYSCVWGTEQGGALMDK